MILREKNSRKKNKAILILRKYLEKVYILRKFLEKSVILSIRMLVNTSPGGGFLHSPSALLVVMQSSPS